MTIMKKYPHQLAKNLALLTRHKLFELNLNHSCVIVCHPISSYTTIFAHQLTKCGAKVLLCPSRCLWSDPEDIKFVAHQLGQDHLIQEQKTIHWNDPHDLYSHIYQKARDFQGHVLITDFSGSFIEWLCTTQQDPLPNLVGFSSSQKAFYQTFQDYFPTHRLLLSNFYLPCSTLPLAIFSAYHPMSLSHFEQTIKKVTHFIHHSVQNRGAEDTLRALVIGYDQCGQAWAKILQRCHYEVTVLENNLTRRVTSCFDGFAAVDLSGEQNNHHSHSDNDPDFLANLDLVITTSEQKNACHKDILTRLKPGCVIASGCYREGDIDHTAFTSTLSHGESIDDQILAQKLFRSDDPSDYLILLAAGQHLPTSLKLRESVWTKDIHYTLELVSLNYLLSLHDVAISYQKKPSASYQDFGLILPPEISHYICRALVFSSDALSYMTPEQIKLEKRQPWQMLKNPLYSYMT
ncbi:MAG: hypothetical protein OXC40_03935 [Proteobacteria bacterium]|nr:hypothetical protein [Pseudomonadota bacterium]